MLALGCYLIAYTCEKDRKESFTASASNKNTARNHLCGEKPLWVNRSSVVWSSVTSMKSQRERGFDIEVTSTSSSRSSPSFCCRRIVCYSSATQINSPAPTPDSSLTQECSFCGSSSSGHARFALCTTEGENSLLPSSVSFPLCCLKGLQRQFTPNEMLRMDLKEDGRDWDSWGWQIF